MAGSTRFSGHRAPEPQPKKKTQPANPMIRRYFEASDTDGDNMGEDWLTRPEFPTTTEILGPNSRDNLLEPNCIKGPWDSAKKYLKTHYELHREDIIAPLRHGIATFRADPDMTDDKDICIYEKVHMARVTMSQKGLAFRVKMSTRRASRKIVWECSSRLMVGSLVALSPIEDRFSTICSLAIVASRAIENIQKSPPEVDLFFVDQEDLDFDPQKEWIMMEARNGYFEASRHLLMALQKLAREKFHFNAHICHLDTNIDPPGYRKVKPILDFKPLILRSSPTDSRSPGTFGEETKFDILENFPTALMGNLNIHQQAALKEMLSKKIAIVQGPPGTGKTFVSVTALKLLLSDMAKGDPPLIIATHTNHALDQLICHVSTFEKNFIRIGGGSSIEAIQKRTLFEVRQSQPPISLDGGLMHPARMQMQAISSRMMALLKPFSNEQNGQPLTSSLLYENGIITAEQYESLQNHPVQADWVGIGPDMSMDPLDYWLEGQTFQYEVDYPKQSFEIAEDDVDRGYEQLRELEAEQSSGRGDWDNLRGKFVDLQATVRGKSPRFPRSHPMSGTTLESLLRESDLYSIPIERRGSIYNKFRDSFIAIVREKVRRLGGPYMQACAKFQMGKWERDYEVLKDAKIIGMTTTGLSKYRALVNSLKPRIIMIEEAAEVTEAPIAAACFESLHHLILVGDHQQLRGHTNVHQLSGAPFFLDISMFERLIDNGFPYSMLREQRRMAPAIRELLLPIYGDLEDHASVKDHAIVTGMGHIRSFFFNHSSPESGDRFSSKINEYEATMVVEFVLYLLLNRISSNQITILTFYNGQKKLISKDLKSHKYLMDLPVKVTTVDSYQGEENDIVILSLVRSNNLGNIGFLAVDNRVCVALSRARRGFYIFGNANCVKDSSQLWGSIVKIMSYQTGGPSIGTSLPLTCENHGNQTMITTPGDWELITGGCALPCGGILECGHPCPVQCHGFEHTWIVCPRGCLHVQPCCGARCSQLCGNSHSHQCSCVDDHKEESIVTEIEQLSLKPNPIPKTSLAINSKSRPPTTKVEKKKTSDAEKFDQHDEISPMASRHESPQQRKDRQNEALVNWGKFAGGGARQVDNLLDALARAKDPNSIQVQQARALTDKSLIPESVKADRNQEEMPTRSSPEPWLIDLDSESDRGI